MTKLIKVATLAVVSMTLVNCQNKLESAGKDQSSLSPSPSPGPSPNPSPSDFTGTALNVTVAPGAAATVTLTISKALAAPAIVGFQTSDDTAVAGMHYLATSGSTNIATGATTVSITIPTTSNIMADYNNRRFKVTFSFTGTNVPNVEAFVSFNPLSSKVTGLVTNGIYHTCSIKNAGLYCWGLGSSGELGNGATGNAATPSLVASMDSGVTDVAAGNNTSCAIRNGGLHCWGLNNYFQIGDGVAGNSTFPRAVFDMASGVTGVSVGTHHVCAIKSAALYCWGRNDYAQVGHNNGNQQVPYRVPGFETGVTAVAAGYLHTCAIKNAGVYCWGYNGQGELGIGNFTTNNARNPTAMALTPITGLDVNTNFVATGGETTCALKNGALYCWGYNGYGQLGLGSTANNSSPQLINGFDTNVSAVATGQSQTCAIKNGGLFCWGNNAYGQLGYNDTVARLAPSAVPVTVTLPAGERFIAVSVSANLASTGNIESSCGRTSANKVYCWGYNGYNQASATAGNRLVPTDIPFFN